MKLCSLDLHCQLLSVYIICTTRREKNENIMRKSSVTTLNMVFSVTYYMELCNAIAMLNMLNWLFRHYRTLTTLLGKTLHHW